MCNFLGVDAFLAGDVIKSLPDHLRKRVQCNARITLSASSSLTFEQIVINKSVELQYLEQKHVQGKKKTFCEYSVTVIGKSFCDG